MSDDIKYEESALDFLKRLEKSLRTMPRDNEPSGLFVKIPDVTLTAWSERLRELILVIEA